jgi:hypothetical protein
MHAAAAAPTPPPGSLERHAPPAAAVTPTPGALERYYSVVRTDDTVVCCAPNKVCVVFLSKDHACFADGRRVTGVTFSERIASAKISGKRKRGAAEVAPDEQVGTVACDDGTSFPLRPGVRGRVLELGSSLGHDALRTRAGYALILQSSAKEVARLTGVPPPPSKPRY